MDEAPEGDGPVVLLVDDEAAIRRTLAAGLELEGFRVVPASGGRAALAAAESVRPAVVLLDLSMPDLDGLEVIPVVLAQSPDTGIVVFSGFEAARMRGPASELGAHRYVEKGRPLDELRAAIREVGAAKRSGTLGSLAGDDPPDDHGGGSRTGMTTMWNAFRPRLRPWLGPGQEPA